MTIQELKKYIYDNEKIEYVLEEIGCHSIKYHSSYYTCGNCDGNGKYSITVYNDENLNCINYTRSIGEPSDLITLVCFNKKISLREAIKYLHKLFGLKHEYKKSKKNTKEEDKIDPLDIFKKIKKRRKKIDVNDIEIYDSKIIQEYEPILYIDWAKEDGITEFTRKKFNIGYSYKHKRIIIPVRYWAGDENDYIGITSRTVVKDYDLLGIPKYYPLKKYKKTLNIYGLQENYEGIQRERYVCVAESQKSVLKRHSRLDNTVVAIESHSLSDEQIRILISLNVEIVIAMDKEIDINYVRSLCSHFYGIRQVSYIYDKYNLLKDKESPMDATNKIYNYLFKYRVNYDDSEHKEYLKYLKEKK